MKSYKPILMTVIMMLSLITLPTAVVADNSDSDRLFDWAEQNYAHLFSPAGQSSATYEQYYYRYYPDTNTNLGTSDSQVFYYKPDVNPNIQRVGVISNYITPTGLDPTKFVSGALKSDPVIVDCTLSDGTQTSCYEITTVGVPAGQQVGPFCPKSITTNAESSGIWLDGSGIVYQADGDFIVNLPNIYGDSNWQLYDVTTGKVKITDTQEACEAAARPDVDPAYQNYCVECSLDYVNGGVSKTYLIPTTPTAADTIGSLGHQVGVALNGGELAAPAPVNDILSNYTIAAFDDCGGHINPHEGYHYHAATGCTEVGTQNDGHAGLIGYAFDGYGVYGTLDSAGNETVGLDECRGHSDDKRGYHYHVASPGENLFIGCYRGKTVAGVSGTVGGPPAGDPDDPPQ